MRILQVVPTYLPATRYGGPIHSVHGLASALAGLGHEVDVLTTSVDGERDSAVALDEPVVLDGVRVWYFRSPWLRRLYFAPQMQRRLRARIGGYDLVHVHSVFLWPTSMAARLARRASVPYVVSPRGMLVPELIARKSRALKTAWIALVERFTLERASAIHLTSALELADARRMALPLPNPIVIENGVELPAAGFAARCSPRIASLRAGGPYALYLGRIHPKKDLERAIAALAGSEVRLIACGPDDEGHGRELQRIAAERGVRAQLAVEAEVHGDDKWALLAGARCVILPSLHESFGNVVLEAMAVGRPVIVAERVGAADVVRAAGCGSVCGDEPGALARALQELWHDGSRADALGTAGRRYVQEHLTWPAVAARMADAYRAILERRA